MDKYTIDFTNVKYYLDVHEVIKKSLDFPDYYGRNWCTFVNAACGGLSEQ